MTITAIESVLQQLRSVAQVAQGGAADEIGPAGGGFADELRKSLQGINEAQHRAYGQAEAFELGKPGIALNDVMVDLQKANVAFQMGLQVRNRLVAAYQEIMNLPV